VDGLLEGGFGAVFLALGAHRSLQLHLPGEELPGVHPSIQFLKAFNMRGEALARGRVAVIGGGNSAVDAARVAIRQPGVESVTILYRRTREEMPAFAEEIEAAQQEGVGIETLVSPVGILSAGGRLSGVECIRNALGSLDDSGRRRPVAVPGSQFTLPLETLVVAISEGSDTDCLTVAGANQIEVDERRAAIRANPTTLETNRPGVFAGGDVVTGPNTVVDAIAAGKRAAKVIERYLRGESLEVADVPPRPEVFVEPAAAAAEAQRCRRVDLPRIGEGGRGRGFDEVELSLAAEQAVREASRCLRCDLEFTGQGR